MQVFALLNQNHKYSIIRAIRAIRAIRTIRQITSLRSGQKMRKRTASYELANQLGSVAAISRTS